MSSHIKNNFQKICLLSAYLFPVTLTFWVIANFGVNVPFLDEWELINLFDKVSTGSATFGDFFTQHNEHRIFIPKIIFIILGFASGWNTKIESYFGIFLVIVAFYTLDKIAEIPQNQEQKIFHLFNITICILLFSLVQYENWLWGFQLSWFLINTCVILAIFFLVVPKKLGSIQKLSLSAIFCFIASFSLAHGLLSWLALIPTVVSVNDSARQRKFRLVVWIVLFASSFIIYLIGYQKQDHHPDILFFLKEPLTAGMYFLNILGNPIGKELIPTAAITLIILFIFGYFNIYYLRNYQSQFGHNLAPWLSLGWFATLFALVTTLGRAGFGIEQAVAPRYTTVSILLIISVLQMWRLFIHHKQQRVAKNSSEFFGWIFFVSILAANFISNSTNAIAYARETWVQRTRGEACLELINFIDKSIVEQPDNCLKPLEHNNPAKPIKLAKTFEKLGMRDFPKDIAFITAPSKNHGNIDIPATIDKPLVVSKNGNLNLAGWVILPEQREQPKIVLLSYGSNQLFFADAVVKLDRPDVAKSLNSSLYLKSGWDVNVSPSPIPLGETTIKVWVYNPDRKQFVKLNGEPKIQVVE